MANQIENGLYRTISKVLVRTRTIVLYVLKFPFIYGFAIGLVFFVWFYPLYVLNPASITWLNAYTDLQQHYVGWTFYRTADWTFPIGMISNLAHPFGLPVTYMDSIPLIAIPFKLVSNWLPSTFQYFGLWGLLCYCLQGGFGALIASRFTSRRIWIAFTASFFVMSPIMMQREFIHTALASHWVILAGIWLILKYKASPSLRRDIVSWSLLLVSSILIHPYLFAMTAFLHAIYLVLSYRTFLTSLAITFPPYILSFLIFWVIGGFNSSDASGGGLGVYALNLNSLYNPLGWSHYFSPIDVVPGASFEAMNYLGAGMLGLAGIGLFTLLLKAQSFGRLGKIMKSKLSRRIFIVGILCFGMILLSLSPMIQSGGEYLLRINIPEKVFHVWSIFRATGRLFWPIYYLLMTGIFLILFRHTKNLLSSAVFTALLLTMLTIQMVDITQSRAAIQRIHELNSAKPVHDFNLDKWKLLCAGECHILSLDGSMPTDDFFSLSRVAVKYDMTMNDGYFAHRSAGRMLDHQAWIIKKIESGEIDLRRTLVIAKHKNLIQRFVDKDSRYQRIYLDGYHVLRPSPETR